MRRWGLLWLLAIGLAAVACASDQGTESVQNGMADTRDSSAAYSAGQLAALEQTSQQAEFDQRLIVRDAKLNLTFDDIADGAERVGNAARAHGGRVQSSRIIGEQDGEASVSGVVVVRVPVESFDEALDEIKGLAKRVVSEETNSDDVTEEYVDLDAQVRNLQATEAQLQTIMDRAETVDDVLSVQRELTNVRDDIERLQGRMQLLSASAAESLITVNLTPSTAARPIVGDSWSIADTVRSSARGLVATLQVLADVATWIVMLSPLWLPALIIVLVARRRGMFGFAKPGTYGTRTPSGGSDT